ncbi:hypothetical protein BC828DRAFT_38899 [Blastocladiella britannica]|nr:hypothetical protein BC828DRAFT_38899 [Blastocladiella britannica]
MAVCRAIWLVWSEREEKNNAKICPYSAGALRSFPNAPSFHNASCVPVGKNMIDHVTAIVLAYAATDALDVAEALAMLHVIPRGDNWAVTAAVLTLGLAELRPDLAVKHGHGPTCIPRYPRPLLIDAFPAVAEMAAKCSDLASLQWLHASLGPQSVCHEYWQSSGDAIAAVLSAAAAANQIAVLEWFSHLNPSKPLGMTTVAKIKTAAIKAGHLPVLEWLEEHGRDLDPNTILFAATRNGHLPIVQWAWDRIIQSTPLDGGSDTLAVDLVQRATAAGHVSVLAWLDDRIGPTLVDDRSPKEINTFIRWAYMNGCADVLEWWWVRLAPGRHDRLVTNDLPAAFGTLNDLKAAIPYTNVQVMEWVVAKIELHELYCLENEHGSTYVMVTLHQLLPRTFGWKASLPYLDWWWETCRVNGWMFPYLPRFAATAATAGKIDDLEWEWSHVPSDAELTSGDLQLFFGPLRNNQVCSLEWLWEKRDMFAGGWPTSLSKNIPMDLLGASTNMPLEITYLAALDWWSTHPGISKSDLQDLSRRAKPFSALELWCRAKAAHQKLGCEVVPLAEMESAVGSPMRLMSLHRLLSTQTMTLFPVQRSGYALLEVLTKIDSVSILEWIRAECKLSLEDLANVAPDALLGRTSAVPVLWWVKLLQEAKRPIVLPVEADMFHQGTLRVLTNRIAHLHLPIYVQDPTKPNGIAPY